MGDATAPKGPKLVEIEQKLEGTDVDYYNNAAKYWENVDGTVDGMLGGFGNVSVVDIDGSNKLLKSLFKVINYKRAKIYNYKHDLPSPA